MGSENDEFAVAATESAGTAVISITGELDLATAPQLRDAFVCLVNRGIHVVTVDMARLGFIDSTGLGVLVTALKRFRELGGDLTLRSPNRTAMNVLEITGLTKIIAIS